jgi:hypothetical protein
MNIAMGSSRVIMDLDLNEAPPLGLATLMKLTSERSLFRNMLADYLQAAQLT